MKKRVLKDFDKKKCILNEIEKIREKIYSMIKTDEDIAFDDEIVKISQLLDQLIVDYLKMFMQVQKP